MSDRADPPVAAGKPRRLVLTLGTDHHRFDRVVDWVDAWVATHRNEVALIAQVGTSHPAAEGESHGLMPSHELQAAMRDAAAIVCHGGPGTILEARAAGVEPIVVPRDPAHDEHVDGHQQRFARWMAERDGLVVATDEASLHAQLDRALVDPGAFERVAAAGEVGRVAQRLGELVDGLFGGPGAADGS